MENENVTELHNYELIVNRIRLRSFQKIFFNKDKSIGFENKKQIDPTLPWNPFESEKVKTISRLNQIQPDMLELSADWKILSDELAESWGKSRDLFLKNYQR